MASACRSGLARRRRAIAACLPDRRSRRHGGCADGASPRALHAGSFPGAHPGAGDGTRGVRRRGRDVQALRFRATARDPPALLPRAGERLDVGRLARHLRGLDPRAVERQARRHGQRRLRERAGLPRHGQRAHAGIRGRRRRHGAPDADARRPALGQRPPERILDWGSRSIHAITGPARRLVEQAAGASVRRAYFYGCSTGGHQAYAEIQRYPGDFDGVVAGAPGNNRVRLNAAFLWQFLANHERGSSAPVLPAAKLPVITRAVVAACDGLDGVIDGVVDDPRRCRFDPASLSAGPAKPPTA